MKKASFITLAIILSMALLVAGCGSANSSNSGNTPSAVPKEESKGETKEPVKLKFWGGVPAESGPQAVIDSWNQENPDIQVTYERYVNDDAGNLKLETALLSSTDGPDIFITYGDERMTKRVDAGMAAPLDDLISKEGFDVEGVIGSSDIKKFEDKYYYLPGTRSKAVVMINKKALDEIGEKVPTDWTWDDFAALAKKLTNGSRKGTMTDPAIHTLGEMTLASSKPQDSYLTPEGMSNFDSPALKKGLEIEKELEDSGAMTKYTEVTVGKLSLQNELLNEKVAMMPAGLYLLRYIKDTENFPHDFPVVFAPMPQYEKGGNVNPMGGTGDYISINNNSANKEAAMKFISWYLQGGNIEMVPGGRIPSNKKADSAEIAKLLIGDSGHLIDTASLTAILSATYTYPTQYNVPVPTELKDSIYKDELEKYLLDVQSIDVTLANMKKRADEAIQKAKK